MYHNRPNLYIGFHGCDEQVRNQLVTNPNVIKISEKPYEWLGHGVYVWENNYQRALQWAKEKESLGKIEKVAVLGVIYVLGNCLDLTDLENIEVLQIYYENLKNDFIKLGKILPTNKDVTFDTFKDKLIRELDCMVIEYTNQKISEEIEKNINDKGFSAIKHFDTSRGIFTEGGPAYDGAGIQKKNHIQICIRNMNCLKAFFVPRNEMKFP